MPARTATALKQEYSYKEAFLASLAHRMTVATTDWPTVRCWTKSSLDRMFKQVRDEVGESTPPQSNMEILNWMKKLGVACAIEADGVTFYLLEVGASLQSEIDPLELMMAFEPSGVISYFSALAFHSLTSQMPSQHHIAILYGSDLSNGEQDGGENVVESLPHELSAKKVEGSKGVRSKASPFGQIVFSYSGIPFYRSRRIKRLVPGVQKRSSGPRSQFRITTFEQTLVDTLHKPQKCGGPAVVFEAWQEATASRNLDEERMVQYLKQMEYPSTTRRVGAMFQLIDYVPGAELGGYLSQSKDNLRRGSPYSQISLLPGFDYSNLAEEWLVKLP